MLDNIAALLHDLLSFLLSLPDYLFVLLNALPGAPKFLSQGYGNPKLYFDRRNLVLQQFSEGTYDGGMKDFTLTKSENESNSSIVVSQGRFTSPIAHLLPKESHHCHFRLVEPADTDNKKHVYILMLPATGEMGSGTRKAMAQRLAHTYGWSSVILTAPFYGRRKPSYQKSFFIGSVTDILLQAQGIIEESAAITKWILSLDQQRNVVCHTGFSFGAAMAACTSAFCLQIGLEGSRMACAPYVGSASPNVLADGVLETAIEWRALNANCTTSCSDSGSRREEPYACTRKRLYDLLDETQLSVLAKLPQDRDSQSRSNHTKIAVSRGASFSSDGFIQRGYSQALESQLSTISSSMNVKTKAERQWRIYPGGHAFAALVRPYLQQKLLKETVFELLEQRGIAG